MTDKSRHNIMSSIKSKNTEIEKLFRLALWKRGYRYTKNDSSVFGKPDICFRKKQIAIFCDSEFWHGYDWENAKNSFKSNISFWHKKIEANMNRDVQVTKRLEEDGWSVLRFWGNEIQNQIENCIETVSAVYISRK